MSIAVALVVLTALWIVLAVVDTGRPHVRRRSYWFALLIGALADATASEWLPDSISRGATSALEKRDLKRHSLSGTQCRCLMVPAARYNSLRLLVPFCRTIWCTVTVAASALQRQATWQPALVSSGHLRGQHGGMRNNIRCACATEQLSNMHVLYHRLCEPYCRWLRLNCILTCRAR